MTVCGWWCILVFLCVKQSRHSVCAVAGRWHQSASLASAELIAVDAAEAVLGSQVCAG